MPKTKCQTPGAWFLFRAGEKTQWSGSPGSVEFLMTIPLDVVVTKQRARLLEKALHDAAEEAMAPWFKARNKV